MLPTWLSTWFGDSASTLLNFPSYLKNGYNRGDLVHVVYITCTCAENGELYGKGLVTWQGVVRRQCMYIVSREVDINKILTICN